MKRIPLSVATGLMLVTDYMIAAAVVFFLSGENRELLPYLEVPTSLPQALFLYLFRPTADLTQLNQKWVLQVAFFVANTLLYAMPAYFFLTLLSRRNEEKEGFESQPPEPSGSADKVEQREGRDSQEPRS